MILSKAEQLMYQVMKAFYESGIPISFKGSMVLKAFLIESGYMQDTRHTVDIDANWISKTEPTADQIVKALQKALDDNDIHLDISMYRMFGIGRSAGLNLADSATGEVLFSMDIDVNRPIPNTKIYELEDIRFSGVTPAHMIADKLAVISSDTVFRRIKDVIDLYYISQVFKFEKEKITDALAKSGRKLGSFEAFNNRYDELKHSYDKFRYIGDISKPPFEEVYETVKKYIAD